MKKSLCMVSRPVAKSHANWKRTRGPWFENSVRSQVHSTIANFGAWRISYHIPVCGADMRRMCTMAATQSILNFDSDTILADRYRHGNQVHNMNCEIRLGNIITRIRPFGERLHQRCLIQPRHCYAYLQAFLLRPKPEKLFPMKPLKLFPSMFNKLKRPAMACSVISQMSAFPQKLQAKVKTCSWNPIIVCDRRMKSCWHLNQLINADTNERNTQIDECQNKRVTFGERALYGILLDGGLGLNRKPDCISVSIQSIDWK